MDLDNFSSISVLLNREIMNMIDHSQGLIPGIANRWLYGWALYTDNVVQLVANPDYNGAIFSLEDRLQHILNRDQTFDENSTWTTLSASDLNTLKINTVLKRYPSGDDVNTFEVEEGKLYEVVPAIYFTGNTPSTTSSGNQDAIMIHIHAPRPFEGQTNPLLKKLKEEWDGNQTYDTTSEQFVGTSTSHTVNAKHVATSTTYANKALIETNLLAKNVVSDNVDSTNVTTDNLDIKVCMRFGEYYFKEGELSSNAVIVKDKLKFDLIFFRVSQVDEEWRLGLFVETNSGQEIQISEWSIELNS